MRDDRDRKIRVLIIDDSAVIRHLLTELLKEAEDIEVVGTAQDPVFAMKKIRNLQPDVLTLDVEMPRKDGLTFLEELMDENPLPVVMVSALTRKGCETTLKALELGAIDYVSKPSVDVSSRLADLGDEIIRKIRVASRSKVRRRSQGRNRKAERRASEAMIDTTDKIVAIGASTGGTQAITEIITALPENIPGIVIVQHMPPMFTRSFAKRLNSLSRLDVKEAATNDRVIRGSVLIAPGNEHTAIRRNGALYYTEVMDGPMINYVRPSVDVLFRSVAKYAGKNAVGVILTGMGEDGARGLLEMKNAGAFTIAQDEASSVVFGMPKKAIEMGAVDRVAPLEEISRIILEHLSSRH